MYPEIRILLDEAEERYLKLEEIVAYKHHVSSLAQRLQVYELLRDNEIAIFQPIADQLLAAFPQHKQETIERALKNWLGTMRYCAMAMLLNNPMFLQHRLLEWLTDIIQVHQTQGIDTTLYQFLQARLPEILAEEQMALLQPFLAQVEQAVMGTCSVAPVTA